MTELNVHSKYIDKRINDITKSNKWNSKLRRPKRKMRKNWAFEMRKGVKWIIKKLNTFLKYYEYHKTKYNDVYFEHRFTRKSGFLFYSKRF